MDDVTDILLRMLDRAERDYGHILNETMRSRSQLTSSADLENNTDLGDVEDSCQDSSQCSGDVADEATEDDPNRQQEI